VESAGRPQAWRALKEGDRKSITQLMEREGKKAGPLGRSWTPRRATTAVPGAAAGAKTGHRKDQDREGASPPM